MSTVNGADYIVAAKHPRRDGPLVITAKDGTPIAVSGQTCAGIAPALLASMLANGYLELAPAATSGEGVTDGR